METQCESCREAEMPRWKLYAEKARKRIFGLTHAEQIDRVGKAFASTTRALAGIPVKSWYEKHKEAFEETGEQIELERMLRHVKER